MILMQHLQGKYQMQYVIKLQQMQLAQILRSFPRKIIKKTIDAITANGIE